MRVKTYKEAVRLANSAGLDAANRRMKKAGRSAMSAADFDHAAGVTQKMLGDLGFDVAGWVTMAGIARNEPDPAPRAKRRAQKRQKPVQLAFGFI